MEGCRKLGCAVLVFLAGLWILVRLVNFFGKFTFRLRRSGMGRRWNPDIIPDIEPLDADDRTFQVTTYPDGRITADDCRTFTDDESRSPRPRRRPRRAVPRHTRRADRRTAGAARVRFGRGRQSVGVACRSCQDDREVSRPDGALLLRMKHSARRRTRSILDVSHSRHSPGPGIRGNAETWHQRDLQVARPPASLTPATGEAIM